MLTELQHSFDECIGDTIEQAQVPSRCCYNILPVRLCDEVTLDQELHGVSFECLLLLF